MEKFYIDRQFGHPIWIEVENGIVLRCFNEKPKFIARMNELYVGKSITFLNEDFVGRAMKGTYHHLRPDCITTLLRSAENYRVQVSNLWNKVSMLTKTSGDNQKERDVEEKRLRVLIDKTQREQYAAEKSVKTEKERILTEHKFEMS